MFPSSVACSYFLLLILDSPPSISILFTQMKLRSPENCDLLLAKFKKRKKIFILILLQHCPHFCSWNLNILLCCPAFLFDASTCPVVESWHISLTSIQESLIHSSASTWLYHISSSLLYNIIYFYIILCNVTVLYFIQAQCLCIRFRLFYKFSCL